MKIDIFSHICTTNVLEALQKKAKTVLPSYVAPGRPLTVIDQRLRAMDRFPDVLQVLTMINVPLSKRVLATKDAIEVAKIANDDIAELLVKYPAKFIAGVACLPLADIDASLKEAERAITQMNFRGVQIFTNIDGESLGTPKFKPLYEMMAHYDLPIWIHPEGYPTSLAGDIVRLNMAGGFGWPFESTVAMTSLVEADIFRDYPNIKFIMHHCGGMISFYSLRIGMGSPWARRVNDFHNFYVDTALHGNTAALMCGYDYFGADHLLFGTDAPLPQGADGFTLQTIRSIERMNIPEADKDKIFSDNALKLLKLVV